jgi:hypothetical protein
MSWDQGMSPREDLPPALVEWLDTQCEDGTVQLVSWFGLDPDTFAAHYYDSEGHFVAMRTFRRKATA